MSLSRLRENMKATIEASVPDFVQVRTHGGRFTEGELRRWAVRSPCAIVSILGITEVTIQGLQPVATIQAGCFVVAKDLPGQPRDVGALLLTHAALRVINPSQRWGDEDAHGPTNITATNLFSGTLDNQGVAIWAVTWRQGFDLVDLHPEGFDVFETYHVDYDLEESLDTELEASDTVTLETEEA